VQVLMLMQEAKVIHCFTGILLINTYGFTEQVLHCTVEVSEFSIPLELRR